MCQRYSSLFPIMLSISFLDALTCVRAGSRHRSSWILAPTFSPRLPAVVRAATTRVIEVVLRVYGDVHRLFVDLFLLVPWRAVACRGVTDFVIEVAGRIRVRHGADGHHPGDVTLVRHLYGAHLFLSQKPSRCRRSDRSTSCPRRSC